MILETVVVGPLGVNCYVIGCEETKKGMVLDPGEEPEKILRVVQALGLSVGIVLNTHGHFDHVGGNAALVERTGGELLLHEEDVPLLRRASATAAMYGLSARNSPEPHRFLRDGDLVHAGNLEARVLHTPGHTAGGCCLYFPEQRLVFTGDTLFDDSVGRTDLPGGSHPLLIASIREKLLTLPDDTRVFPGHGPSSTIGKERRENPYLQN